MSDSVSIVSLRKVTMDLNKDVTISFLVIYDCNCYYKQKKSFRWAISAQELRNIHYFQQQLLFLHAKVKDQQCE